MSVKVMSDVWQSSQSKGTARLVLLAIADHCNPSGIAWPSLTQLASYVNVDRRNVIHAVNTLVEIGELKRIKTGKTGRATTYKVVLGSDASVTSDASDTSDGSVTQVVTVASPQPSMNRHTILYREHEFNEFWKQYPKKVGKGAARTAYKSAIKKTQYSEIMAGLSKYNPDVQFTCNPATWLNQERWNDEPDNRVQTHSNNVRQTGGEISGAYERFRSRRANQS